MPRFNLPFNEENAFVNLMYAIKVEVEFRRREFVATEELKSQVRRLSAFLTQENSKFGIVLAGGCGNVQNIYKTLQGFYNGSFPVPTSTSKHNTELAVFLR